MPNGFRLSVGWILLHLLSDLDHRDGSGASDETASPITSQRCPAVRCKLTAAFRVPCFAIRRGQAGGPLRSTRARAPKPQAPERHPKPPFLGRFGGFRDAVAR